jgi:hypothetical protein
VLFVEKALLIPDIRLCFNGIFPANYVENAMGKD